MISGPKAGSAQLILAFLALSIAAGTGGGGDKVAWSLLALVIGLTCLVVPPVTSLRSRSEGFVVGGALACCAYVAFQLIPLPIPFLQLIDPVRVEIARAPLDVGLVQSASYAPVSIAPEQTWV